MQADTNQTSQIQDYPKILFPMSKTTNSEKNEDILGWGWDKFQV